MRLLWLSGGGGGGGDLSMVEAVEALSERGHQVHVVLPIEDPLRSRLASAASIHICWHNRWLSKPLPTPWARVRQTAYNVFKARLELARLAQATAAQVVVSNGLVVWAGALAAKRAGRPHVWFLQEFGLEDHGFRFHFGRRATFAFMKRNADFFLVNSSALRSHFAQWLPEARLRLVHYAVEVPPGLPTHSPGDGKFRLVMVGTRAPSKGQQDAVAALRILADQGLNVELDLIGNHAEAFDQQLRDLATDAVDRVHFVDFQEDPFKLVARADVALMCSRSEALGRVTVEAIKLGKPVVGAAAGATPELVRPGWNGFLYEPGNPADLAQWIKRLYYDREAAREMGRRAQAWAIETFNRDVYGSELEGVLEELGPRVREERP